MNRINLLKKNKGNIIFGYIIFLLMIITSHVHAGESKFDVKLSCSDEFHYHCDINKFINGEKSVILKDIRSPQIIKLNNDFYQVSATCGSPCSYEIFIGRSVRDFTNEFIAIDKRNNCLIETNSKSMTILSRKLLSKKRKVIAKVSDKEFKDVPLDPALYNIFRNESFFDEAGDFHLITMLSETDRNGNTLFFKKIIEKPCE